MLSLASCRGRYYIAWAPVVSISSYGTCLYSSTLEACCMQKVELENQRNDAAVEKHFIQFSVSPGFFLSFWKNICKYTHTCKQEICSTGLELVRSLSRLGSVCALQAPHSSRLETWHEDAGPAFWIPPGPYSGLKGGWYVPVHTGKMHS